MKNQSFVGHRHFAGVTQFCTECKRVRKLYGSLDRFDGHSSGDISGFWVLSPSLVGGCALHRWKDV